MNTFDKIEKTIGNWLNSSSGYIAIACLFLIFGVAIFIVVINKYIEYRNFKKYGVSVQGMISNIESKNVYVTFMVEDKEYTFKSHYYDSDMRYGDSLPVLYYPDNPNKAIVAKANAGVIIFFVFGIILVFCGIGLLRTYKMYIT
ncbi:MAG: DUF3592 domain-containing protein [Bacteroidales bacterium]|nr:DUF3592 domain-containing protein [Bacteroidales bacterium]